MPRHGSYNDAIVMVRNPIMWFFYALMASIFWGINYALAEKIGQRISLISLITLEMALGLIYPLVPQL